MAGCLRNDPNGTRTRVAGVKGRSPRPLDDGAGVFSTSSTNQLRYTGIIATPGLRQGAMQQSELGRRRQTSPVGRGFASESV